MSLDFHHVVMQDRALLNHFSDSLSEILFSIGKSNYESFGRYSTSYDRKAILQLKSVINIWIALRKRGFLSGTTDQFKQLLTWERELEKEIDWPNI
jgi:hypothetical protein